jgi:TorA maturation chaperone TorD
MTMETTDRLKNENLRSECYRLLAALFYPPERSRLLDEATCLKLAGLLDELYPETPASDQAAVMQEQLSTLDENQMKVDHATLFVGPFALKAAPYGSIYLENGRRLMGDTTVAANDLYTEAGLQLTLKEPADHIAIELEFMHYLTSLAAEALAAGQEDAAAELAVKQRRFLKEHLGAWVPPFCAAIVREADTLYYRALADCLNAFVGEEMKHLNLETTAVC